MVSNESASPATAPSRDRIVPGIIPAAGRLAPNPGTSDTINFHVNRVSLRRGIETVAPPLLNRKMRCLLRKRPLNFWTRRWGERVFGQSFVRWLLFVGPRREAKA